MAGTARDPFAVFAAVLRGYGPDESAATHAIRRLRATVHGFVDLETGGGFGMPEDLEATYDQTNSTVLRSLR